MIYLIGGPPKCGKTTLAKKLSLTLKVPWISTDSLQAVVCAYTDKKNIPKKFPWSTIRKQTKKINDIAYNKYSSKQIISAYRTQAKTTFKAIEMMALCELTDKNDIIIEGYHIEPQLTARLKKKYGIKIKSIFLIKNDAKKFVRDIKKTSTPNDWIVKRTKNENIYNLIAKMICDYGKFFKDEAIKKHLKVIEMDNNFNKKISEAITYLKA